MHHFAQIKDCPPLNEQVWYRISPKGPTGVSPLWFDTFRTRRCPRVYPRLIHSGLDSPTGVSPLDTFQVNYPGMYLPLVQFWEVGTYRCLIVYCELQSVKEGKATSLCYDAACHQCYLFLPNYLSVRDGQSYLSTMMDSPIEGGGQR